MLFLYILKRKKLTGQNYWTFDLQCFQNRKPSVLYCIDNLGACMCLDTNTNRNNFLTNRNIGYMMIRNTTVGIIDRNNNRWSCLFSSFYIIANWKVISIFTRKVESIRVFQVSRKICFPFFELNKSSICK